MKNTKIQHIRGKLAHLPLAGYYYRNLEAELDKLSLEALDDLSRLLWEVEQLETQLDQARRDRRFLPGVIR